MKKSNSNYPPYKSYFDKYENSPFLKNFVIPESTKITKIADAPHIVAIYDSLSIHAKEQVKVVYASENSLDNTPFIKIYDFNLHFIIDLSKMARNIIVFLFDYNRIKYSNNLIIFNINDFKTKTNNTNESSIYAAIKELIAYGFWAKNTIDNIYWLNQDFLFVGERKRLIYNKYNKANKERIEKSTLEQDKITNPNNFGITNNL